MLGRRASQSDKPDKKHIARLARLPKRPKEIDILDLRLERGNSRVLTVGASRRTFLIISRDAQIPTWTHSRSNLTALSHSYNLYIVALGDQVWIYVPSFPSQGLGSDPALRLKPTPTGINRRGYLEHRKPNDINHVVVDYLGHDEILLFCSDCGDVWFYYISRLWHAIHHPETLEIDELTRACTLAPDFRESVGVSAWGLTVHRKSRKIAVSSNNHEVTIFQLALLAEESKEPSVKTTLPKTFWKGVPMDTINDGRRSYNLILRLPDTQHNIPCIAFCNTTEDEQGRFLAVGDISGRTILWDMHKYGFEYWTAHFCNGISMAPNCRCFEGHAFNHAIWGLYWLDPESFVKYGRAPQTGKEDVHDISSQVNDIPSSSKVFRYSPTESAQPAIAEETSITDILDGSDSDASMDSNDLRQLTSSRRKFVWHSASYEDPALPLSPFLWISSKQIAFHQPRTEAAGKGTAVVMDDPLTQTISLKSQTYFSPVFWRTRIPRMSMHAAIPELGIVVVASPSGRCAVLSLLQGDTRSGKPYYFYRVDWLLPTKEQEERGDRPGYTLMGVAVGPIQGQLGRPQEGTARTWRLMLQYCDFSVLSYELSRGTQDIPDLKIC